MPPTTTSTIALPTGRMLVDASLWSANLTALGTEIERMSTHADMFHFDVADGCFVPDLLFFPDLMAALRPVTCIPFHAHLMVTDPASMVNAVADAGADVITAHIEAQRVHQTLESIKAYGKMAGLAVGLATDPVTILDHLELIDVLVMVGTELGTRGTASDPAAAARISRVRGLLAEHSEGRHVTVLADGGIRRETVGRLADAGADGVVAGSLLFGSPDPAETVSWLRSFGRLR